MSYDIYLEINTGGEETATICEVGNHTSNVVDMWWTALGGKHLAGFHGRLAGHAIPDLVDAVIRMTEHPETYEAMNPPNGWGNAESARSYLRDLLRACAANPLATIRISR